MHSNIIFYIAATFIFLSLKFGYKFISTDALLWLLKPVSFIVEIISGAKSVYVPEGGYYFKSLNIIINKSCSGFNFWLLCFLMLNGLALNFYHTFFQKTGVLLASITIAYFITVLVNTCRIVSSIAIAQFNSIFLIDEQLIHQATGILTNLTFLIIIYLTTNFILIKIHNAKLT